MRGIDFFILIGKPTVDGRIRPFGVGQLVRPIVFGEMTFEDLSFDHLFVGKQVRPIVRKHVSLRSTDVSSKWRNTL